MSEVLCKHPDRDVEVTEAIPLEGETYGEMYGQCRCCGVYVKAFGMIEDDPGRLERSGEWEIDNEAI